MNLKKIGIALAITLLITPQAQARSLEKTLIECGIGAILFENTPAAAAISNIIWDLGTTATISDMSSDESCKGKSAKVAMLIGSSYDKLEIEIAEGQGQYLKTLTTLSGKSTNEIRSEFSILVASNEYKDMLKAEKAEELFNISTL